MIKRLKIQNFQSHKDTSIEFHPGVNVITGTSDSGKTAIIRALKWVIWNQPNGEAFRSNWGGDTVVKIETDSTEVTRSKGKGLNQYELKGLDDPFTAIGKNVPDEIKRALNLSTINMSQQLDSPFLLSDSAGQVAGHFNRIAKLEVIDLAVQRIKKTIESAKSTMDFKKESRDTELEKLEVFEFLDKFEMNLEVLEELEKSGVGLQKNINSLSKFIEEYLDTESQIEESEKLEKYAEEVDRLIQLKDDVFEYNCDAVLVQELLDELAIDQSEIDEIDEVLKVESKVGKMISVSGRKKKMTEKVDSLTSLLAYISVVKKQQAENKIGLEESEKEFIENFPDICPLCETDCKH